MLKSSRRSDSVQFIDAGRVFCPVVAKDVEFDRCVGCCWTVDIDDKVAQPFVRCRPPVANVYSSIALF